MELEDFTLITLKDRPDLKDQVLKLIENELDYPNNEHFDVDFYPLFNEENFSNLYILENEDQVIAHIGLKPRTLKYTNKEFPVALLGGLCIKEDWQNKGIFKSLFSKILNERKDEFLFYFLWSDQTNLYSKFGFKEFGLIEETGGENFKDQEIKGFKRVFPTELDEAQKRNLQISYDETSKNFIHITRTKNDWDEILEIKSCHLYMGRNSSYFFAHKGADLKGIIHEHKGLELSEQNIKLWKPVTSFENNKASYRYMGFLKISNFKKFETFISHVSDNKISITEVNDEAICFSFRGEDFKLAHQQFIQGLFGPNYIKELEEISPPIVILGLDSI